MSKKILIEICVESLDAAIIAETTGADRIELCSDLVEGGVTPSAGIIKRVVEKLKIPVNVLIRPRGGDFCYSDSEFNVMKEDVEIAKSIGASGVVLGILNNDGTVDKARMQTLTVLSKPMNVTFHRAFDMTRDPFEALETLIELGADRILTSGQESTAQKGTGLIKKLIDKAAGRIIIMPGGGINEFNAKQIIAECSVQEIHSSAVEKIASRMIYRNEKSFMGKNSFTSEYEIRTTSAKKIKSLIEAIA